MTNMEVLESIGRAVGVDIRDRMGATDSGWPPAKAKDFEWRSDECSSPACALGYCMTWADQPEGHDFWHTVHQALVRSRCGVDGLPEALSAIRSELEELRLARV